MAIRSGQDIPDRIKNAPQLLFGSDLYLKAFIDLYSSDINWITIIKYSEFYDFDMETIEDLMFVLNRTNVEYSNYLNSKKE
jgi:hypothetical protein